MESSTQQTLVRLGYRDKVPVSAMQEILNSILREKLTNMNNYEGERCGEAVKWMSEQAKTRLKALGYDRYKFVVQVVLGERREQGLRAGSRCFWDAGTDNQASEVFTNVRVVVGYKTALITNLSDTM
jgi:tctex1 domain-containing protein 2